MASAFSFSPALIRGQTCSTTSRGGGTTCDSSVIACFLSPNLPFLVSGVPPCTGRNSQASTHERSPSGMRISRRVERSKDGQACPGTSVVKFCGLCLHCRVEEVEFFCEYAADLARCHASIQVGDDHRPNRPGVGFTPSGQCEQELEVLAHPVLGYQQEQF